MEYYSAFKGKEILTQATTRMSLEDITLRARYQAQKDSCCGFCGRSPVEQSNLQGRRAEWWLPGAREGGFGGYCSSVLEVPFCTMKSAGGGRR